MGLRGACVALLLTGCRFGFDDVVAPPVKEGIEPQVCATQQWTSVDATYKDVDLSTTVTPSGLAISWIPRAGGALYGAMLDATWSMTTDPAGTMIKPGPWLSGSLQYVVGQLIAGEAEPPGSNDAVKYDTLDADFSNPFEFGCPNARHATKPPVHHAGGDRIAPNTWDDSIRIWKISSNWVINVAPAVVVPSATPSAIAAVDFGPDTVVVWAATDGCHVAVVHDPATADVHSSTTPCPSPRLVAAAGSVALVYETAAGVALVKDLPATLDPKNGTVIAPGATSPRIAHDGTHYWIAYLDSTGAVRAGYKDATGMLYTTAVGSNPTHDAFELAIVDMEPWLVSFDASGLHAAMTCTP